MLKRARLLAKAVLRKRVLPPVPAELDALVVSPGGVATTMVMEQIELYIKINDSNDRDGLKHLPRPSGTAFRNGSPKVLFLAGEASVAAQSLERRGWLRIQAAKLACPSAILLPSRMAKARFEHCVVRQRQAWSKLPPDSILFVEFNDIWDRLEEISKHLGIDDSRFITTFPPRRIRQSDASRVPGET